MAAAAAKPSKLTRSRMCIGCDCISSDPIDPETRMCLGCIKSYTYDNVLSLGGDVPRAKRMAAAAVRAAASRIETWADTAGATLSSAFCAGTSKEPYPNPDPDAVAGPTRSAKRKTDDDDDDDDDLRTKPARSSKRAKADDDDPGRRNEPVIAVPDDIVLKMQKSLRMYHWNEGHGRKFGEEDALIVFPTMQVPSEYVERALGRTLVDTICKRVRDNLKLEYREIPPYVVFRDACNKMVKPYLHRVHSAAGHQKWYR